VSTPEILVIGSRPDDASFPSGHAANAFAGASVLARRLRAQRVLWWSLALLIAYSRVYLGVHYPLDVIGGALPGFVCGTIAGRVVGATRFRGSVPLPPSRNASEDHRGLGGGG